MENAACMRSRVEAGFGIFDGEFLWEVKSVWIWERGFLEM